MNEKTKLFIKQINFTGTHPDMHIKPIKNCKKYKKAYFRDVEKTQSKYSQNTMTHD